MFVIFKDSHVGHVLQLRSETVAVRKRMIYDGHMKTGNECDPNFLTFVLRLRENPGKPSLRKLTRTGIEPGPAAREVTIQPGPLLFIHLFHCETRRSITFLKKLVSCLQNHFFIPSHTHIFVRCKTMSTNVFFQFSKNGTSPGERPEL